MPGFATIYSEGSDSIEIHYINKKKHSSLDTEEEFLKLNYKKGKNQNFFIYVKNLPCPYCSSLYLQKIEEDPTLTIGVYYSFVGGYYDDPSKMNFKKATKNSIISLYNNKRKSLKKSFFAKECINYFSEYQKMKNQEDDKESKQNLEECLYEGYSNFVEGIGRNHRITLKKLYVSRCAN